MEHLSHKKQDEDDRAERASLIIEKLQFKQKMSSKPHLYNIIQSYSKKSHDLSLPEKELTELIEQIPSKQTTESTNYEDLDLTDLELSQSLNSKASVKIT